MLSAVTGGDGTPPERSPASVAAMLAAVRGNATEGTVSASPPSIREMLAAVRGDAAGTDGAVSPPSVAAMLGAVGVRAAAPAGASRAEPAKATSAGGARPSVAEILAAARAADGGDSPAPTPAATKPAAAAAGKRPSVAEMLARARGEDGGAAPVPAAKPAKAGNVGKTEPDGPPPVPLSVGEMIRALRDRDRRAAVARPAAPRGGWFSRLFGSCL